MTKIPACGDDTDGPTAIPMLNVQTHSGEENAMAMERQYDGMKPGTKSYHCEGTECTGVDFLPRLIKMIVRQKANCQGKTAKLAKFRKEIGTSYPPTKKYFEVIN